MVFSAGVDTRRGKLAPRHSRGGLRSPSRGGFLPIKATSAHNHLKCYLLQRRRNHSVPNDSPRTLKNHQRQQRSHAEVWLMYVRRAVSSMLGGSGNSASTIAASRWWSQRESVKRIFRKTLQRPQRIHVGGWLRGYCVLRAACSMLEDRLRCVLNTASTRGRRWC